jgi:hypothetical protein
VPAEAGVEASCVHNQHNFCHATDPAMVCNAFNIPLGNWMSFD